MSVDRGQLSVAQTRKLVAQYQKVQAELQTVKAAYLSMQEKVTNVESVVKEKEVVLRSSVEENDMLTFNNQRLTKRVEQLMIQLHEEKATSKGSWGGFFSGAKQEIARLNEEMAVSKEQLCRTLEENESLVSQMVELRDDNTETREALDDKLQIAKELSQSKEEETQRFKAVFDASIMELTDEKSALNGRLTTMDRELEATRALMTEREQTMTTINRQLSSDLERTQHLYDHKVAFDDTRVNDYNKMNCPGFDRVLMVRKIEIAEEALGMLETLTDTFRIHDAALRERYNLMGRNLSAMSKLHRVNERIWALVPERVVHLEALLQACAQSVLQMKSVLDLNLQHQLVDDKVSPNTVAKLFKRVVLYYNKMLPYELLSLVEEARKDTTVPVLQARNYVLVSTNKRFVAALDKLSVYVQLAFRPEKHSRAQEANESAILKYAHSSMSSVHKEFQAYASHLISKISQEHRAPFVLPELKAVNEKMLNSLSTIVTSTGKMLDLLNSYLGITSTHTMTTIRGVDCDPLQMSQDLPSMQTKARTFFARLHAKEPAVRVRYTEAVRTRKELTTIDAVKEELKGQIQDRENQLRAVHTELSHKNTELQSALSSRDALQAEVLKLTAALKKQEAESASIIKAMNEKKHAANKDQLEESTEDAIEIPDTSQQQIEIVMLQGELLVRDQEIATLNAKLEEHARRISVESLNSALDDKDADMDTTPAVTDNGSDPNNDLQKVVDSLRDERDKLLMRHKDDAAAHEAEIARLQEENRRLVRERTLEDEYSANSTMQDLERRLWSKSPLIDDGVAKYSQTVTDENGETLESALLSDESRQREHLIRCFYEAKLQQLHKQVAIADKKACELARGMESRVHR